MSLPISTKVSTGNLATDFLVSTETIRVDAILISHSGAGSHQLIFYDSSQATQYIVVNLPGSALNVWLNQSWIADGGLFIPADDSTLDITVFYSSSGV